MTASATARDTRPVIILGMHRSGTSSLAGSLEECGLFLGDVITEAPHNAKGNREDKRIMDLHEDVLAANDGAWDEPPERVVWSEEHRARRDRIIAEKPTDRPWGFKDPRTLLTLDGWLEALPEARLVGSFRHPASVAASLARRNAMDRAESDRLWVDYNRRLLRLESRDLLLISFDTEPMDYQARIACLAEELGLRSPGTLGFFEEHLRHDRRTPDPAGLGPKVGELYRSLLERAL